MSPMLERISSKFGEVKLTATLPLPTESGLRLLRAFDQVPPRGATDHDDRTGSSRARYRPISPSARTRWPPSVPPRSASRPTVRYWESHSARSPSSAMTAQMRRASIWSSENFDVNIHPDGRREPLASDAVSVHLMQIPNDLRTAVRIDCTIERALVLSTKPRKVGAGGNAGPHYFVGSSGYARRAAALGCGVPTFVRKGEADVPGR